MAEDQELLAVAVSRFADSCGPALHVDCPFSRASPDGGGLVCGKECRQVVSNLVRPRAPALGDPSLPFDAQQVHLASLDTTNSPTSAWPIAALLFSLKRAAKARNMSPTGVVNLRNVVDATSAIALLQERGINSEGLLRSAVWPLVTHAIDSTLFFANVRLRENYPIGSNLDRLRRIRNSVLDEVRSNASRDQFDGHRIFRERLHNWLCQADPTDGFSWALPDNLPVVRLVSPEIDDPEYVWLLDRYSETYLDKWNQQSLRLEFRYLREGYRPQQIPQGVLKERELTLTAVSVELASTLVHSSGTDIRARAALLDRAVEAIQDGRRDLAATMFAVVKEMEPTDPEWANNHGFCLIPDDPFTALGSLLEARRLGRADQVLSANLALTYLLIEEPELALKECETSRERGWLERHPAFLWDFVSLEAEGEGPLMVSIESVSSYLANIAIRAAIELNKPDIEAIWVEEKARQDSPRD